MPASKIVSADRQSRPLPVIIRAPTKKVLIVAIIASLGGIWMIREAVNSETTITMWGIHFSAFWMGILVLVIGLTAGCFSILGIISNRFCALHLDADGFIFYNFFRYSRVRWQDITSLGTEKIGGLDYISWSYSIEAKPRKKTIFTSMRTSRHWWGKTNFPDAKADPIGHAVTIASALPDVLSKVGTPAKQTGSDEGFLVGVVGMKSEKILAIMKEAKGSAKGANLAL